MSYLSEYLLRSEYECSHCHSLPPDLFIHDIKRPYSELFNIFDSVREAWGKPIPVSSGYRCPHHNKTIGGSACSVHMFGLALDIVVGEDDVDALFDLVNTDFSHVRIGKYPTFLHIDVGYDIRPRASHHWQRGARW